MTTQSPAADSVMDIHSCSYYCQLPKCVLRQRDELVRVYVQGWKEKEPVTVDGAGFNGMTDGGSLTYAGQRKAVEHITTELSAAIGILQKAQQRAEAIDCQPQPTTPPSAVDADGKDAVRIARAAATHGKGGGQ
jgi:hypothetical protein